MPSLEYIGPGTWQMSYFGNICSKSNVVTPAQPFRSERTRNYKNKLRLIRSSLENQRTTLSIDWFKYSNLSPCGCQHRDFKGSSRLLAEWTRKFAAQWNLGTLPFNNICLRKFKLECRQLKLSSSWESFWLKLILASASFFLCSFDRRNFQPL